MDIVLEQLMGYVDEIASLVSDAAPLVWEMLLLQVKVEAVGSIILAVIGLILIIGACFTFAPIKKAIGRKTRSYETPEAWYVVTAFLFAIGGGMFFSGLYDAIARYINPAWYAIKLLITQAQ